MNFEAHRELPVVLVEGLDHPARGRPRVVDEDVDAPEVLRGLRDHPVGVRLVHEIAGEGDDLGARFALDLLRRGLEPRRVAGDDGDLAALPPEGSRDPLADADAAARHQGHLAAHSEIHRRPPERV